MRPGRFEDDGRTVAPMDARARPSAGRGGGAASPKEEQTGAEHLLTRTEGWLCALGALSAALLIALAFLAGLAALVGVLILLWS